MQALTRIWLSFSRLVIVSGPAARAVARSAFVSFVSFVTFVLIGFHSDRGNAAVSLIAVVTAVPQNTPARSASSIDPPRSRTAM
jgi:hypothetical protein